MPWLKLIVVLALLVSPVLGADYYISPTGDDTTGDGSIGSPWKSLQKIDAQVDATNIGCGDTVHARGGTYTDSTDYFVSSLQCTNGNEFTIKNYTGETPIFQTVGDGVYLTVFRCSTSGAYWVLEGLQIKPTDTTVAQRVNGAIYLTSGCSNITIRDMYVESTLLTSGPNANMYVFLMGVRNYADYTEIDGGYWYKFGDYSDPDGRDGYTFISYTGADYVYVHDTYSERGVHDTLSCYGGQYGRYINNTVRNSMGHAIMIQATGCLYNLYEGNDIQGAGVDPINYTKNNAFLAHGDYNIIRYNRLWDAQEGAINDDEESQNMAIYDGDHNKIYGNTMWGGVGINLKLSVNSDPTNNVLLNNVIAHSMETSPWGQWNSGEIADVANPCTNQYFTAGRNNDFFYNYISSYVSGAWQNDYTNFYDCNAVGQHKISYMETNYSADWANNVYDGSDPKLTNPDNGDFTISAIDSSLVDAGGEMTLANGSGSSSTSLVVDDVHWFWPGDQIAIGGLGTIRTIDTAWAHGSSPITLTSAASWSDNDPIYIYATADNPSIIKFVGNAPDIGADEFVGVAATGLRRPPNRRLIR